MEIDYAELDQRLSALCDRETDPIALMASIACEVYQGDDRFDWVGFYRNMGSQTLKIGPYQGGHGCLDIRFDQGVCGAAARTRNIQSVADVNSFAGHIACASSTKSELVIPVVNGANALLGVFDIDSDQPDAFTDLDAHALDRLLRKLFSAVQAPV